MSRLMSLFMAGSAIWVGSIASAHAAEAVAEAPGDAGSASDGSEQENRSEIVVTGTLIRGIAPVGTPPVTVTQQEIQEAGGVTIQQLLSKVPQVSFFNAQPTAGTA